MMRGATLRSVADLLGHTTVKMTMRYAHLSPAFLQAEISLLDEPSPDSLTEKRARKGQLYPPVSESPSEVPDFVMWRLAPRAGLETATLRLTGWYRLSIVLILRGFSST